MEPALDTSAEDATKLNVEFDIEGTAGNGLIARVDTRRLPSGAPSVSLSARLAPNSAAASNGMRFNFISFGLPNMKR
jgi:hypothetical protein